MSTQEEQRVGFEDSSPVPASKPSLTPFTDMRQPTEFELSKEGRLEPKRLFAEPRADLAVEFLMNSFRRLESEMDTIKKENQELRRLSRAPLTGTHFKEEKERERKEQLMDVTNHSPNQSGYGLGSSHSATGMTGNAVHQNQLTNLQPQAGNQNPQLIGDFYFPVMKTKGSKTVGLFGEANFPSSLPGLVKLESKSSTQFHSWKERCLLYLESNGLIHLVTKSPKEAFQKALLMDGGLQEPETIRSKFVSLHMKVWVRLYEATILLLHQSFFDAIGKRSTPDYENYSIDDSTWMYEFTYGNAYRLWSEILNKLDKGRTVDSTATLLKLSNFRYKMGLDPAVSKKYFDDLIRELELANVHIPEPMQVLYWKTAIPPEMDSFLQGLDATPNLTVQYIYELLEQRYINYQRYTKKKPTPPPTESGLAGTEDPKKKSTTNPKPTQKGTCTHCKKKGHSKERCWILHPHLKPTPTDPKPNTEPAEEELPFIAFASEDEFVAELAMAGRDTKPGGFVALMDSGATTHVVNDIKLLHDTVDSPETGLTSIVKGRGAIIRKRGKLWLDKEKGWFLRNVAYIPNATVNLISLACVADAEYYIGLNKEQAIVRKDKGQGQYGPVIMRGERVNRLWVFNREGIKVGHQVGSSLAKSKRKDQEQGESQSSQTQSSQPQAQSQASSAAGRAENSHDEEKKEPDDAKAPSANSKKIPHKAGKGKASQQ